MEELMSLIGAGVADLPLRPLLFTAGAAATAAGVYCCINRGDGEKSPGPEDTPAHTDPVCDQATEPALVQPTEVPQDRVTDSVTEAEEKMQKLEDRVVELEELLTEAHRACEMKSKECEREREAHSNLQAKHHEMEKIVMHSEELLKVSLAEAEEKHQKAVESIAQLEAEKTSLTDQVKTLTDQVKSLRDTVQDMGNLLCETHRECDELTEECEREREAHSNLQSEHDELKMTVMHNEEFLKVSLAEAEEKHQKAVESIAQLEAEKTNLIDQVKTLRDRVQDMGNLLCETHRECDELTEECRREREAHSNLQSEYDELKKTLMRSEEVLKVSLAEAEEKHQKAVESIAQLEAEKTSLIDQVKSLRDRVQDMGNLLCETHRECDELTEECEREREAHSNLKLKHNEMNETLMQNEELLKEHGISLGSAETGSSASRIGSTCGAYEG
ncbi:leucine-rich repeat flightless-interacting protein 1-like isoform X2 [Pangasianodon hypophthalmus]|uniref:leucine-rich repeat flightless-interacting protein 1-like isoform X2 n=1 Tax=Pangasianodon hypophthalmus TaxID=310915 RepID=UPI00230774C1|nr:leucine-rich repeat flightless-interacting protein 1-like isoform X2 [Pangasianodon hypophthalmus]